MPLKTSWLNKELILQIIRSTGWITIVYFLVLFFALPLRMLMMYTDENLTYFEPVNTLFQYDFVIQLGLMIVIPILLSIFLFRFLQVKQAADLMHSIPIKREKLFHHYAISGILSLILPVILIGIIVMIVHGVLDLNSFFSIKDVYYWTGTMILINLLLFTAGMFVAMMTGISAVQGLLTYILLLFPAGITVLVLYNFKLLLFGFPSDYFLKRNLETLSPLTNTTVLEWRLLQNNELILYSILTIILYGLSLYFYKKRKVESASEAIAFPKLRSIFKYGVTFCMMLLGGMYFGEVQNNSLGWIIFGYVVGSILGYYIAEMLLQKTWRVFSRVKGLAFYGIVVAVLFLGTQALGVYENNIPAQDEVNNVLFSDSPFINFDEEVYGHVFTPSPLKKQNNIEAVRRFHQQIIKDKQLNADLEEQENMATAFFLYELKNGNKVVRQYFVNQRVYEDFYKTIYQSEEYKLATNEIFQIEVDQVDSITVNANAPGKSRVTINNQDDLREAIKVLQADVLAESYEDKVYYGGRGPTIEILFEKDHFVYMPLSTSYQAFHQWLEEKDLLEQVKVMPEDITSIHIAEWTDKEIRHPEEYMEEIKKASDALEVMDKEQIGEVLNQSGWGRTRRYIVLIEFEEGSYKDLYYLDEAHAPDFVNNYFK